MTKATVQIGRDWWSGKHFLMGSELDKKILNILKERYDIKIGDVFEIDFEVKSIKKLDED